MSTRTLEGYTKELHQACDLPDERLKEYLADLQTIFDTGITRQVTVAQALINRVRFELDQRDLASLQSEEVARSDQPVSINA